MKLLKWLKIPFVEQSYFPQPDEEDEVGINTNYQLL